MDQLEVRLGEYNLSSNNEPQEHQDHRVQSVRIHPRYDNVSLTNDIAILTLSDEVRNGISISPICLPSERENFASQSCVVTGWGNRQAVLKEFFVECLNEETCIDRLRATKLGHNYQLDPSFFCAQSTDQSSCLIDGGGPLVCRRRDSSYAIVGLLSWSVDDYSPDVYVRVQQFLDFLNSRDQGSSTTTSRTSRATSSSSSSSSVPTTTSTSVHETTHISQQTTQGQEQQEQQEQQTGQGEEGFKIHQTESGSSTTGHRQQETSTQVIEPTPAKPVPVPPIQENQDQNEVTGDKKGQAFAWASSYSSP